MINMKQQIIRRAGLSLVAVGLMALTACSSGVDRQVDVSGGEYYTPEEVQKLSKDQYADYCASLDQELANLGQKSQEVNSETQKLEAQTASLDSDIKKLEDQYGQKKSDIDAVQKEIDYYENLPKVWTVKDGEFLYGISAMDQIYADPLKWPRIYRANKDKIEDPNLIYPGWELTIPRDWPTSWTVQPDEYLGKIAWYWEVYNDPAQWTKLYEANKDQISDPDIIWPGWKLRIPRD
jgi:nucleoid-associated protein YgaU